jgi:hypothetical protein
MSLTWTPETVALASTSSAPEEETLFGARETTASPDALVKADATLNVPKSRLDLKSTTTLGRGLPEPSSTLAVTVAGEPLLTVEEDSESAKVGTG